MSVDSYLNPSIVYGQWEGWNGIPLDQPPLFYNGLTESAANLLSSVSYEVVKIAKVIALKTGADMSRVRVFNLYEIAVNTSINVWAPRLPHIPLVLLESLSMAFTADGKDDL